MLTGIWNLEKLVFDWFTCQETVQQNSLLQCEIKVTGGSCHLWFATICKCQCKLGFQSGTEVLNKPASDDKSVM